MPPLKPKYVPDEILNSLSLPLMKMLLLGADIKTLFIYNKILCSSLVCYAPETEFFKGQHTFFVSFGHNFAPDKDISAPLNPLKKFRKIISGC